MFVDLEKAFDTAVMGVPEAGVRMVALRAYEKVTARVVVGEGASKEFEVNIGMRQGSVLSPLLFLAVGLLDLISRKTVMKDAMRKHLCRRPGHGGEWQT